MKKTKFFLLIGTLVLLMGLLASCTATEQVNVTVVSNNGAADTVVTVEKNTSYTLPTVTRDGYTFVGWYLTADFSGGAVTSVTPDSDVTVYAKWEKLHKLTLDTDGGSLATTEFELKAGESIYDKVASLVPEKSNCKFGMWTLDGKELTSDAVMGDSDVTLVAKYKAKYTVEIYLQNGTLDGYDKSSDTVEDYLYVGTAFKSEQTLAGYTEISHTDSVTELVISDDPAKNVFKHYFDRKTFSLTFVSNYPDGSADQKKSETLINGIKTELPFVSFEMDGYYLEGWALSKDGEMVYLSHIMDANLYNGTESKVEEITADGEDITLYAVWSKGYTDLFGGSDIMYVSNEKNTVYLYRGGKYFKGTVKKNTILFDNEEIAEGRLNSDGKTFLYCNVSRQEIAATLYDAQKGLNSLVKLYFDKANGVTYSVQNATGTTNESKGEFFFNEDGYMVTTFTEGDLKDTTITFAVSTVTYNNAQTLVFMVRNDAEVELGQLLYFTVKDNKLAPMTDDDGNPVGDITLNGFGVAYYNQGTSTTSFYYTYDKDAGTITLRTSSSSSPATVKLITVDGKLGYVIYNSSSDVSYDIEDGSKLTVDGIYTATYTDKNGTKYEGFYTTSSSALGGTILSFVDKDGQTHKFMLTTVKNEVVTDPTNPDSGTTTETKVVVTVLSATYVEYYYLGEGVTDSEGNTGISIWRLPLFVFDGKDLSTVTVYGYNKNVGYFKIAYGAVVYNAATDSYTLTVTENYDLPEGVESLTNPLDFSDVKTCVFMLNDSSYSYNIHFWLTYTDEVGTVHNDQKTYTAKNGDTITLVSGMVLYTSNGKTVVGAYSAATNDTYIAAVLDGETVYFDLNEDDASFTTYETVSEIFYYVNKDGTINKSCYLVIDARKKNITYYVITTDDNGQSVTQEYVGSLELTGSLSLTGYSVYRFKSTDGKVDMNFIGVSLSGTNYMFVYDKAYEGTFFSTNTSNGILSLDGYGFAATYSDGEGRDVIGMYQLDGDNVSITASGVTYNFYVNGTSCALRSDEYGKTYVLADNQVFQGVYVTLDGLGGAKVFKYVKNTDGEYELTYVDEKGTYTLDGSYITLKYVDGNKEYTLDCKLGTLSTGSYAYNALNVLHNEVVYTYINEKDWSILRLENDGTATKYLTSGKVETGTYSLVTETLLYYVNSDMSEAYIYVYDTEKGTATPRTYNATAYYTKDLESLFFTKYGFAIFDNSTRYYYTIDDNNKVTLFHLDEESTDKNVYGYVEESFGDFSDVKEYNGKTYYKNDGFAVNFVREADTKDQYPVRVSTDLSLPIELLTFSPSGDDTFSVNGTVVLNGKSYSCTVIKDEEGEMYVVLSATSGYLYFNITINYQGGGIGSEARSTYKVNGLSYYRSLPSYTYLQYYYIYYVLFQQKISNSFGTIVIGSDYDAEGNEGDPYIDAVFGKSSGMIDSNGDLIESIDHGALTYLGNNYYQADFTGADGQKYSLIFTAKTYSSLKTTGYYVLALVREETVEANDGYAVTVSRIVMSDAGYSAGTFYSISLSKDGKEIAADGSVAIKGNDLYYVTRTTDENGKVTAAEYYTISLSEKSSGTVGDEGSSNKSFALYESAKVEKSQAQLAYTADGTQCVEIIGDNTILFITAFTTDADGKTTHTVTLVSNCSYENGVYSITTYGSASKKYTVTVTDGVATLTEVTETTDQTA